MILFDEFHVVCDPEVFRRAFLGYDFSLPTGTTPGKLWRRSAGDRHFVGQYGFPEGDTVPIFWRQVLFIEEPGAAENYRVSGHLCDQFWKLLDPFNDGLERDCPQDVSRKAFEYHLDLCRAL